MSKRTIDLPRIAYLLIIGVLTTYIFIKGKNLLSPLIFAIFLALMLKPVASFFQRYIRSTVVAILLTFSVSVLPLVGISYLACWQSYDIFSNMPSISDKIEHGLNRTFSWMDNRFKLKRGESKEIVKESLKSDDEKEKKSSNGSGSVISKGVKVSSAFISGFFMTLVYAFLLLLYRRAIRRFFLTQFGPEGRMSAARYLRDVQRVTQQYLNGILIVMFILGTLNSVGLWAIGIEHALFFGFMAAFLAVIPYVGTIIGGVLPFAYSLSTSDEFWQPAAVVILFIIIQVIEGNFITPKVAGNTVKLNPLASIFILFFGGAIWGVAGMVLALPMLAIIRTTCKYIPFLQPVSLLLSSELYDKETLFEEKFDDEKYRLWSFFSQRKW